MQTVTATHLDELASGAARANVTPVGSSHRAKRSLPQSYLFFLRTSIINYFVSFVFDPFELFRDPISWLASVIIFPIIWIGLGFLVTVFWVAGLFGGNNLIDSIGKEYANGLGIANWANPGLFGVESELVMAQCMPLFGGLQTTVTAPTDSRTRRILSIPLAKACLLFSSIVYERIDEFVVQATDIAKTDPEAAKALLVRSEAAIRAQAEKWGMRFEGISDLASVSGPFASIFFPKLGTKTPWICLVFKGTTPDNFAEFLVDASINKVNSTFLAPGTVHEGFYTDLFRKGGYGTILRSLKAVARQLQAESHTAEPIPLWITGHSLGSALASLLYYRLLAVPADLLDTTLSTHTPTHHSTITHPHPLLLLRDGYLFGTPSLGSTEFISSFSALSHNPLHRPNILWRIVDNQDVVCVIPPGVAEKQIAHGGKGAGEWSVLNFGHIGQQILMGTAKLSSVGWVVGVGGDGGKVAVTGAGVPGAGIPQWEDNWLQVMISWLPHPILDHLPSRYYERISEMRNGEAESS